jgi:hypothetical protein
MRAQKRSHALVFHATERLGVKYRKERKRLATKRLLSYGYRQFPEQERSTG